jgi:hypothetical protein
MGNARGIIIHDWSASSQHWLCRTCQHFSRKFVITTRLLRSLIPIAVGSRRTYNRKPSCPSHLLVLLARSHVSNACFVPRYIARDSDLMVCSLSQREHPQSKSNRPTHPRPLDHAHESPVDGPWKRHCPPSSSTWNGYRKLRPLLPFWVGSK